MTVDALFEKFDRFADAPDAVAKMRELVLHLAVTGKLVSQDPDDESAKVLLADIDKKREALLMVAYPSRDEASTQLRKQEAQKLPDGLEPLPPGWAWATLIQTSLLIVDCHNKTAPYVASGIRLLRTTNIRNGRLNLTEPKFVDEATYERWSARCKPEPGDILITREAPMGEVCIIPAETKVCLGQRMMLIRLVPGTMDAVYLLYSLMAPDLMERVQDKPVGATVQHLRVGGVETLLTPIPPLAEQKRIVAKVDELMALCDRLEAQQQERETQHAVLARAALARFAEAPTPANLDFLFHKSYTISPADLRKSILTLAVQGRLVPQDPDDEPANEVLAKIECDKVRLAREQGVRLPKNVPPITTNEYPLDIPDSWQWSRIGHLALVIDYGTSQKASSDSSKVPVYRMGNIVGGRLVDENMKYVDESIDDLPGLYLKTNDILFNRTNSYELVGKAGIYTGPDDTATFASYLIRVRLPETLLFPPFYSVAMNAPYYRQTQIEPEVVQQCGQANFNGTKLSSTVVPVPSLAEQRRIVAKVDQLMALVDALETQLAASRTAAANLLSALVAELTGVTGNTKVPALPVSGTRHRGRPRKAL